LRLAAAALAALISACSSSPATTAAQPTLFAAFDIASISNDGSKATLSVTAFDAKGAPGTGSVTVTAPYGDVNAAGAATATATLDANGNAKVTYACAAALDPRCAPGSVLLTAKWGNAVGGASVSLRGPATPTTDGGPPPPPLADGGPGTPLGTASKLSVSISPAYIFVSSFALANPTFPGTTTVTFLVTDSINAPVSNATVTLTAKPGEGLVTLGSATAVSGSTGIASFTVTSNDAPGVAHLTATLSGGVSAAVTVPVLGGPASIIVTANVPSVLGLRGSGIQETGLMTFTVTDSTGTPIPGLRIDFTQSLPTLVNLGHTFGFTDDQGRARLDYGARGEVGVGSLKGTVTVTGLTTSQAVAVRGARPSASGFYFRCTRQNLPVYTTTLQYETTTCIVRLKDRQGNRVGVPTPVGFATEAGAISASVLTKGFDFNNPTDAAEGTVTVTFSSDMGNGFRPVETTPLAADATQFPKQRLAEPFSGRRNPRDQLVTIIAMVRGEEAFIDANFNGKYDPGELFVDQGDPFVDSNDNDVYDSATEIRFCGGTNCAVYNGPNGVWDSDRTIWAPQWVVFTEVGFAVADPWSPGTSNCADYTDNNGANPSILFTTVRVLDSFLNTPASGTTYGATLITTTPAGLTVTKSGGFTELDGLGSMDLSWERVSAANPNLECTVANTVNGVCIMKTEFGIWDSGQRLGVTVANGNKVPTTAAPGHGCITPTAGTKTTPFSLDFSVTGPNSASHTGGTLGGTLPGTFAY
jgi:hypothetical protein